MNVEKPRFSWQMYSSINEKGLKQTAYQISVIDENQNPVWDSGRIESAGSLNIEYEGETLKPTTRYTWKLTVWDNHENRLFAQSWFEIGLMNTNISAWEGAQWIGGGDEDMVLYSHYLPVFKLGYSLRFDYLTDLKKRGYSLKSTLFSNNNNNNKHSITQKVFQ
ncbi:MAG: hypothetical protein ACK5MI_03160 [Mangrovibacterium sp.]